MDVSFWNNRYASDGYLYGESPNGFLTEVARQIPVGPVLCLAEGEGRNAVHLALCGHRVTAVDQSELGLAKAGRLAKARGVEIDTLVADLRDFHIQPSAWAGIVAIFAHLPPSLRQRVHAEVVRGLQPGGDAGVSHGSECRDDWRPRPVGSRIWRSAAARVCLERCCAWRLPAGVEPRSLMGSRWGRWAFGHPDAPATQGLNEAVDRPSVPG